jgi:hypothetical protein
MGRRVMDKEFREGVWFVSIAFMLSGLIIGLAVAVYVM